MDVDVPPDSLSLPLSALVNLSVEFWRVSNWLAAGSRAAASDAAPARHALRRMEDFCRLCELEVRDLHGRPFDPGLAVRVVDTIDDPTLDDGQVLIDETLSPMVLWRGRVVRTAEVVTRRGTGKSGPPTKQGA